MNWNYAFRARDLYWALFAALAVVAILFGRTLVADYRLRTEIRIAADRLLAEWRLPPSASWKKVLIRPRSPSGKVWEAILVWDGTLGGHLQYDRDWKWLGGGLIDNLGQRIVGLKLPLTETTASELLTAYLGTSTASRVLLEWPSEPYAPLGESAGAGDFVVLRYFRADLRQRVRCRLYSDTGQVSYVYSDIPGADSPEPNAKRILPKPVVPHGKG